MTFVAQKIAGEKEPFVLELTTKYKDGKEGKARINILVHKRPAKLERAPENVRERVVYRDYGGPWLGFGFNYVWSRPVYVPVPVPCPGCDWDRGDYDYLEAETLPAEALPPDIPEADIPIEIAEPVPPPEIEAVEPEIEPSEPETMPMEESIDVPDIPMDEPMDMPDMDIPDLD